MYLYVINVNLQMCDYEQPLFSQIKTYLFKIFKEIYYFMVCKTSCSTKCYFKRHWDSIYLMQLTYNNKDVYFTGLYT